MKFYTSDSHFNHIGVLTSCKRPWKTVDEMNQALIDNWNKVVGSGDIVYHLGDFAYKAKHGSWDIDYIISQLKGQIFLIRGNHDDKFIKKFEEWFIKVDYLKYIKEEDGSKIMICHYPMKSWRASIHGSFHLHGHCFSENTELLTKGGFLSYKDIQSGQQALTLNMKTNILEYNSIKQTYIYNYSGEMIKFKNKSGTILVTPEHKMIRRRADTTKLFVCTAKEALKISYFVIPVNAQSKGIKFRKPLEFFILLGLIISEGHFFKYDKNSGNGIRISQKNQNSYFIKLTLDKLNIPYSIHNNKCDISMIHFYLPANYVKQNIYPWIQSKQISKKLMNLRGKQFRAFLAGLVYGDGSIITRRKKYIKAEICNELIRQFPTKTMFMYHTSDTILKNKLSHLCTLNALRAYSKFKKGGFKNGAWYINITNNQFISFRCQPKETVYYNGKTWCAETQNHTLVVRKNGFIFITGNSHGNMRPYGRAMDVGVDVWNYYPQTWETLKAKILQNEKVEKKIKYG